MAVLVAISSLKPWQFLKLVPPTYFGMEFVCKDSGGKATVMSLREVLSLFERGKARDAWVMATS
jgi:hypothetical protein